MVVISFGGLCVKSMISLVSGGRRVLFTGVGVLCNVDSLADMVFNGSRD